MLRDRSRQQIEEQLAGLKSQGLYRSRRVMSSAQSVRMISEGRALLNFCSNDYLGLANDARIVAAFKNAADYYGLGSGASPLVCGLNEAHVKLEEEVAALTGRDKAILFSSGYMANLAIVSCLAPGRHDHIFQDKLNHASLLDGAAMSRGSLRRYSHKRADLLSEMLAEPVKGSKLVLTDAVFSMDGDEAGLTGLSAICKNAHADLVVDEAHSFGVYGENGAGLLSTLGLGQSEVPLIMATFGKAVGCSGAFVAGREELIDLMVQKSRPYIYSTAMPPAIAVAATEGIRILKTEQWRRQHLSSLIAYFKRGATKLGLNIAPSNSAIQPVVIGAAEKAVRLSDALCRAGILITAIRPPTVPANTSRLRITLSAGHAESDVDVLLQALADCMSSMEV